MSDARAIPLVLAGLTALAVGLGALACDPHGGGSSLTTPGIITDPPVSGPGGGTLLRLAPAADTVRLGGSARFVATFVDSLRFRPDPRLLHWSVDDTTLAVVDDTGAVRVRRPGIATVRAAVDTEPPATASLVILDTLGLAASRGTGAVRR
jgi:hypothetical protein